MKTNDLISLLAKGNQPVSNRVAGRHAATLAPGAAVSLVLLLVVWGLNPRLAQLAHQPAFWVKLVWLALLSASGLHMIQRLSRPGMAAGRGPWVVLAGIATMAALAAVQANASGWSTAVWLGVSWQECTLSVAALALPLMAALMWTLRDMAPTRPALTGAASGVAAGALGALIYSLHCPEIAYPFLALWYTAAMGAMALIGAAAGSRLLRW